MAIVSFADAQTESFFLTGRTRKGTPWASLRAIVKRKLDMVHFANCVDDLASPPGNRLEELKGKLKGYYSIRVNDQFRVVFKWTDSGPSNVEVIDYH